MPGIITNLSFLLACCCTATPQSKRIQAPWVASDPSCTYPPKEYITDVFNAMVNGSTSLFYSYVLDDVSWRVMGTHPLAGHYNSKEHFYNSTSIRLGKIEQPGGTTSLVRVVGGCDEEWSVEELLGNVTMLNGMPFVNQYSWSTRWDEMGKIAEVRAYVDSALVTRVVTQNEPTTDSNYLTERTIIYDGEY